MVRGCFCWYVSCCLRGMSPAICVCVMIDTRYSLEDVCNERNFLVRFGGIYADACDSYHRRR